MPDHPAFLAASQNNPADDLPRLVYADWLDEQGDSRAVFVRLEVALRQATGADRDGLRERVHHARTGLDLDWVATLDRPQAGWRVARRGHSGEVVFGKTIPAFIFNLSYHLSPISVYADGSVDCWGYVDLSIFRQKLAQRWVVPRAEAGGTLSIHNLGQVQVLAGEWEHTPADTERRVAEVVRELNPSLDGLIDMQGTDTEERGGIRYAKGSGWGRAGRYRVTAAGERVSGRDLPVFEVASDGLRLRWWCVYADGLSQLDSGSELMAAGALERMFADGRLTLEVPRNTWVTLDGLGRFKAGQGLWSVKPGERVREVADLLNQLNGGSPAAVRCMEALRDYRAEPSEERREALRAAYGAVPEHLRMFCGDMDTKDGPIRRILDGSGG